MLTVQAISNAFPEDLMSRTVHEEAAHIVMAPELLKVECRVALHRLMNSGAAGDDTFLQIWLALIVERNILQGISGCKLQ